jgi:hypothetical protein
MFMDEDGVIDYEAAYGAYGKRVGAGQVQNSLHSWFIMFCTQQLAALAAEESYTVTLTYLACLDCCLLLVNHCTAQRLMLLEVCCCLTAHLLRCACNAPVLVAGDKPALDLLRSLLVFSQMQSQQQDASSASSSASTST